MKNLEKNIIESMQNSSDYQFNTDNFRLIVELSPDMIAILKDKKIVYINPSGIRLLGANSLEKLIGKSITDFIHPSYLEIENNRINQIQCLQDNNFIEEKFISLNGNVIDVELTSYPVNYQDDTFIQMYVREISHHKLIERELKSAEKRFKKLCEHMPNAIIIFDANGKLLDANKPLADISGYCRDELQNQNLFKLKLFSENEILKFVKFMLKATLDKPIGPDQFTLYHKNGNKILVEILAFKIRIKNQFLILNIIHDITKHVQLKEALSLSQKHLNAILHSSPDIIFILDDQLFIDEVYTSRSDLLWFSRESVLSSELNKILPEAAFVKIKDKLVSLNQTNTPISVEFTTKKNNIESHFEALISRVINDNMQSDKLIVVVRDQTKQKRIERLREDTERILKHDMRSPLNNIIGFSQLLLKEPLDEEDIIFVRYIFRSGTKLLNMINHSMDIFKMEEGTHILNVSKFNLISIFKFVDEELTTIKEYKKVNIIYLLNDKLTSLDGIYSMVGDKFSIESLFQNLMLNAVEASPIDNKVTITIINSEDYHHIDIHNYGMVPHEIRDHFFERYVTSGKKGGTGLGTYSAYLITKSHGGHIDFISSEVDTHLIVKLPKNIIKKDVKCYF